MREDEQRIRDVVAEWHRATGAAEIDAVLALMAEDVVFLTAGKPPLKGRKAFESGLRGLLKSHRVSSTGEVQEVAVFGDLAYCWTLLTVTMTPLSGGEPSQRSGSTLSIFRRGRDGAWVLMRDANLLPPVSATSG